jgi:hypothetical protein
VSGFSVPEAEQIRQHCAAKLKRVKVYGQATAVVGCLLGGHWTSPRIVELRRTANGFLLGRVEGGPKFKQLLGTEDDVVRDIQHIAKAAGLDEDELGYLLAQIATVTTRK